MKSLLIPAFVVVTLHLTACTSSKTQDDANKDREQNSALRASADLSSKEQAIRTIHQSLLDDDMERFRKCVTKGQLERIGAKFDKWYEFWREEAAKSSVDDWLQTMELVQDDDQRWRLNEN